MTVKCPICGDYFDKPVGLKHHFRHKHPKVVILDNNPLSIACYLEEYGDKTFSQKELKQSEEEI